MFVGINKSRPTSIPLRSDDCLDMLPLVKKTYNMDLKKLRFQCKCHWTPEKEKIFEDL